MRRFRRLLLLCVALFVVASTTTTTISVAAEESPPTGQFDSPTKFCTKVPKQAGKLNSSSPGVTPDTVTVALNHYDQSATGPTPIDYEALYQALFDEINTTCGGINGRTIEAKPAWNNLTAPNPVAHAAETCLKITEDIKAFYAFGAIGGGAVGPCLSVQHKTMYDQGSTVTSDDFTASKGRIVSQFPAQDLLAGLFIRDGIDQKLFKGHKIAVVGLSFPDAAAVEKLRTQYITQGFDKYGIKAELTALPCQGSQCTQGISAAVRDMKSDGIDMIVLSSNMTAAEVGPMIREMNAQKLSAQLTGPYVPRMHTDTTTNAVLQAADADSMAFIDKVGWTMAYPGGSSFPPGVWRIDTVEATPITKACQDIYGKAVGKAPFEYTNFDDVSTQKWDLVVNVCISVRNFARGLAALGPNVTTARMVKQLATQPRVDNYTTNPNPVPEAYFSAAHPIADLVMTENLNFPCAEPAGQVKPNTACFMPSKLPPRFHEVSAAPAKAQKKS
jgi:hypothetical protein